MNDGLRILMLEDDQNDAMLIQMFLRRVQMPTCDITLVTNKEDFVQALEQKTFDVVLSDHQLPQFSSLEALQICNQKKLNIPFILVTGAVSEEFAVKILQEGASDYVLKDRLQRLPVAIERAIEKQKFKNEKIKAEEALKKSNERFELAVQASFDVIWDFDIVKGTVFCSNAFEKIYGYKSGEGLSIETLYQHIHPDDVERIRHHHIKVINGKETNWDEHFRILKYNDSIAYVRNRGLVLRDEYGFAYRIVGVLQDMTEVRQLRNALLEQTIQRQKEITEITIQAQEKERSEIGKELHDNVNQLLTTAKLMIDTALAAPNMQTTYLNKSRDIILLSINEIRNISHSLMAPSFKEDDFVEAIHTMVDDVNMSGKINFDLQIPLTKELEALNDNVKLSLYRIIQEQLNNILKYSKASKAVIALNHADGAFHLTISDDGVGFNTKNRPKGIGLRNIASRAELYSGSMTITSNPGQGTVLEVTIPFAMNANVVNIGK